MSAMINSTRYIVRLFRIARTLARYDALFPLEMAGVAPGLVGAAKFLARKDMAGRRGERLASALQELGPSFIKLGQALSTRSDLLGEEVAADLSELQDNLPPFSGGEARATIVRELDADTASLFHFSGNQLAKVLQMDVARHKLCEGVGDGDDRLAEVVVLHAGRAPKAARTSHVAAVSGCSGTIRGHFRFSLRVQAFVPPARRAAGADQVSAPDLALIWV